MRRWLDMITTGKSVRRVALDMGLHGAAALAEAWPAVRRRRATVHLTPGVEYACPGGQPLRLDILRPAGPGPHPVLIYLHGGAFAIGSRHSHRALATAYASRGYLVCNVDYRLAPRYAFPAAVEDACAAWSWVVAHVSEFGGDRQRIALAGESAGANLALSVLLACCTDRPEPYAAALSRQGVKPVAALLYSGFLQVSQPSRYRRAGVSALAARIAGDAARSYLGASCEHPDAAQAMADPLCLVEAMLAPARLPPMFIAAGGSDPVTADSLRLESALLRLHSPCSAHYYAGEPHAFHVMFWRENAVRCWRDSFEFLHRHLPVTVHASPADAAIR